MLLGPFRPLPALFVSNSRASGPVPPHPGARPRV